MAFDPMSLVIPGGNCQCGECRYLRRQAEAGGSHARALRLLRLCLDGEQQREFDQDGQFTVRGSNGGRYLVRPYVSFNIFDLDSPPQRLCAGPYWDQVPLFDQMLAQKLALETDEAGVLRVAGRG